MVEASGRDEGGESVTMHQCMSEYMDARMRVLVGV